ncbi:putative ATP-binding cassette protein subfamily A,member 8, partial [Trypanosoma theileri]
MNTNPFVSSNVCTHNDEDGAVSPFIGPRGDGGSHRHVPSGISQAQSVFVEEVEMNTSDSRSGDTAPQEVQPRVDLVSSSSTNGPREGSTDEIPPPNKEDITALLADMYATRTERNPSCLQQLSATLQRVLLLKLRRPCGTISEFVVPVLFIVGTFILWKIIGGGLHPQVNYYNSTDFLQSMATQTFIGKSVCYNDTIADTPIEGIQSCSILDPNYTIICAQPGG